MDQRRHVRLISPSGLHKPAGYSHVAEVTGGRLIYVAGQIALDPAGNLVGAEDFGAQVRQVFANLAAALASVGATFKDVIKLNYYCADSVDLATHLPLVRAVRDALIDPAAPPASTFVVVRRLVNPAWLIEVEAVAVAPAA
jgi:enamine deaminase RidA (YjgF/YER057c/UK114 family)